MTPLESTGLTLFILVLVMGLFLTVFSFPGTVIILVDAFLYALLTGFTAIGVGILLLLAILSLLAEAVDFAFGMAGAAPFGFSSQGAWAAVVAASLVAALLTPFLFGLGTFFGIFLGGCAGLLTTELVRYGSMKPSLRPSAAAILGRLGAVLTKGCTALSMIIVTLLNIYS